MKDDAFYAKTAREIAADPVALGDDHVRRPAVELYPVNPDEGHARRVLLAIERERARREALRTLDAEERGAILVPAFDTLRDRLARPVTPTRYRIEGWMPRDARVMLTAQFKAGKTTARDNLIRSLVDGDRWLGRYAVDPIEGTVAAIDFEMGDSTIDIWLRPQQIRHDDRVRVLALRGRARCFDILDDAIRGEWAWHFQDAGTRFLIVDCLRPILDALGLDEKNEAGRFLVALDALLAEAGIPECVVVQHMGHVGERARGDSRLRDWPDAEWRIVRHDDDPASARYIAAYGRDVDVPESQLVYDTLTRRLTIADGSRRDAAIRDALGAVCATIGEATGPQSGRAIKRALADTEHSRKAIEGALGLGEKTGALTVQDGPKRSRLYSLSVPVSRSEPQCPGDTVSVCPAAYRERDTHTHSQPHQTSAPAGTLDATEDDPDAVRF